MMKPVYFLVAVDAEGEENYLDANGNIADVPHTFGDYDNALAIAESDVQSTQEYDFVLIKMMEPRILTIAKVTKVEMT
jgi:hypothetical protein